jgi:energy-coupling factor transporter ATP-binding protein EcfA2
MRELIIKNFKAFEGDEVSLSCDNRENILCYGENGTGKSSIFEAIKLVFHRTRLEKENVSSILIGDDRIAALRQFLMNYNNKTTGNDFSVMINGQQYDRFDSSTYYAYLISGNNLRIHNSINVRNVLMECYLAQHDIDRVLTSDVFFFTLIEGVNTALHDFFLENIQIEASMNSEYSLLIKDPTRNLSTDDNLTYFYNEAKLHLVILLTILSAIELMAPCDDSKKKLLVLDDFFTSLDVANRTFLFRYISDHFSKYQVVILTHNIGFFNLCHYLITDELHSSNGEWAFYGLFEYNNTHCLYRKGMESVEKIENDLLNHPDKMEELGNRIRKYFEILLHQFVGMLMIGAKEKTDVLIKEICKNTENRFFRIDQQGVHTLKDLVVEIKSVLNSSIPDTLLREKMKQLVSNFESKNGADSLSNDIHSMRIYQKVVLHQASHGRNGFPHFSENELKASVAVLKKLEKTVRSIDTEVF